MTVLLTVALIVVVILWLQSKKNLTETTAKWQREVAQLKAEATKEKTGLEQRLNDLQKQNQVLSKYQAIVDAEATAAALLSNARQEAAQVLASAKEVKATTTRETQALKDKAQGVLNTAMQEAQQIREEAHKRAEAVAGDAWKALQNAESLEKTVQAMKNVIEGYGNKYIIPTYTLLDELAEEYGHQEAGEELKKVRERTRMMIQNGTAATCDYVEANRKETAINFVLDAFNGKVDSILASVKRDNYGTLEQKVRDAFQVVNNNGKAFRNAVITEEYLGVRLLELRWAVAANELKWLEREEQRLIKERIREEEKARREYEKAIRETEREEELLKKAIEKAQKEVEKASEAQKEKYEVKLRELNEQLKVAEAKNQRALSMAQQTKCGNVYIISNVGSFGENVYKIGMTRRLEPLDRIKELGDASVPFEFDVHSLIYSDDAPKLERELHKKFLRLQMNKVNPRKEFFRLNLKDIREEIEKMGIEAKWTMTAEAREYQESLAIEREILTDKAKGEEWLQHQLQLDPVAEEEELGA